MSEENQNAAAEALSAAVLRLLRPLVRLLLRYGIPYAAFADLAKRIYIEVARQDFVIEGRKQSTSRVSLLTGLSRKEVRRVETLETPTDAPVRAQYNRAARVIGGWITDVRFRGTDGSPATLPVEGDGATFAELVRVYSGDVPTRAILDELARVGAVEETADGRLQLMTRAYIADTGGIGKMEILGTEVARLTQTIGHNIDAPPQDAHFQRSVAYDNLPAEVIADLRASTGADAQSLLESINERMAVLDRDTGGTQQGTGRKRVSVGVYYFEDDVNEEEES